MNDSLNQQQLLTDIATFSENSTFNQNGIEIYQRNLLFSAANALANSYPTINLLLGDELLRILTKQFIIQHPKSSFDWATWGSQFPEWLKQHPISEEMYYLHDCALLDWSIHLNYKVSNTNLDVESLSLIASNHLNDITIEFNAGTYLLSSKYPIVEIYQAHIANKETPDLTKSQEMLASQEGQTALITLEDWITTVRVVKDEEMYWLDMINNSQSLANRIENSNQDKDSNTLAFEQWLPNAIEQKLIYKIKTIK